MSSPGEWLREARDLERAGAMPDAAARYERAIAGAERDGDRAVLAEALRRYAVVLHYRDEPERAHEVCCRSYVVAREMEHDLLAAEALNTLGGLELKGGSLVDAQRHFLEALQLGGASRQLRARAQQNLGILANIQGNLDEAVARYERSLGAYRDDGDEHGCAIAYHNLGMVSADRKQYTAADCYFRESLAIAERTADPYLRAHALINHAEVDVVRQRFENARQSAEAALALFDGLEVRGAKTDAYRVIGAVYRETGRPELAEARLRSAIELAAGAGLVLSEAEAARELAVLYQGMGRNQDALRLLNAAHRLFQRLDARADLVHVGGKMVELQGTYLALVRAWGQSIESTDASTFGHCERVARDAVALARALGLSEDEETTILLAAYLHDVGMIRVPHEILRKAAPLTLEESAVLERHPVWGLELLADVEFPWDLKPLIRWHHEHWDGTGYPDGLQGEAIPLGAQIIGIVDEFDGLTRPRAGRPGLSPVEAVERMTQLRGWWSERVFAAFSALNLRAEARTAA